MSQDTTQGNEVDTNVEITLKCRHFTNVLMPSSVSQTTAS
jgi:hypothetical protein